MALLSICFISGAGSSVGPTPSDFLCLTCQSQKKRSHHAPSKSVVHCVDVAFSRRPPLAALLAFEQRPRGFLNGGFGPRVGRGGRLSPSDKRNPWHGPKMVELALALVYRPGGTGSCAARALEANLRESRRSVFRKRVYAFKCNNFKSKTIA